MLFDPEKPTIIDTDSVVITSDKGTAQRRCRELAEREQLKGEVCEYLDVLPSKSGKSYRCIFKRETDEGEQP